METDERTELFTLKEAAARIGLSFITLQQQARKGVLATRRIGHQYVVTLDDLTRYAEERQGKRGFASPAHPYYGTRPPHQKDATSSIPSSASVSASVQAESSSVVKRIAGSMIENRRIQPSARASKVAMPSRVVRSRSKSITDSNPPPVRYQERASATTRVIFVGHSGNLYQMNRNGRAIPIGDSEIARWRDSGMDVIRDPEPEPWKLDAAADDRPERKRYQQLADYLAEHAEPGEEITLTFDEIEAILGFRLPPHRKRIVSANFSRRSPEGMTWGMRGWSGKRISSGTGVCFRRGIMEGVHTDG